MQATHTPKHRTRKRFGQHFLQDQNVIHHITSCIDPRPGQQLVEIGPGLGAITGPLLAMCGRLDVVELDRDCIPQLRKFFASWGNHLRIHEADALQFDFSQIDTATKSLRIVGNLPYNISTPLIFHLLRYTRQVLDMHFMLQKEVVQRLAAHPGGGHYGRLSIMVQYSCQVDNLFEVPPAAFSPRPKVDSALVRLRPHITPPHAAADFAHFSGLVKASFAQRRKTLRNNLKDILDTEQLQQLNINPNLRAEQLTVADYVEISNYHSQLGQKGYLTHDPTFERL